MSGGNPCSIFGAARKAVRRAVANDFRDRISDPFIADRRRLVSLERKSTAPPRVRGPACCRNDKSSASRCLPTKHSSWTAAPNAAKLAP